MKLGVAGLRSTRAARGAANRGFTLVEMLVAMGLLMMGMTAVIGLFAVGLDQLRDARVRAEAGDALPRVLDDVEGRLFDAVQRALNDQALGFAAAQGQQSSLPEELSHKEELRVPGLDDLRYAYVARRIPGREFQYLTEIRVDWRIRGRTSSRTLKSVFELRPTLVQRALERGLRYEAPR
ncbi:MAG: prepilin-type N-terminal cleavage/methylation domain-containing protein [Planctomycetes bacterium]|nr:prepilin-type N-terminal cleavage/methylation domain-containing protein [Planctomycetota bacterium]